MIIVLTIIKIQLLWSFHSKKRERLSDQLNPNYQSYYNDFTIHCQVFSLALFNAPPQCCQNILSRIKIWLCYLASKESLKQFHPSLYAHATPPPQMGLMTLPHESGLCLWLLWPVQNRENVFLMLGLLNQSFKKVWQLLSHQGEEAALLEIAVMGKVTKDREWERIHTKKHQVPVIQPQATATSRCYCMRGSEPEELPRWALPNQQDYEIQWNSVKQ